MQLGNQQRKNNASDNQWQWSAALTDRIPQEWLVKVGWAVASESTAPDPVDLLDAHAQQLVAVGIWSVRPAVPPAADADELAALFHLSEQVAYTIRPAFPAPRFRKELRQALLSTHRQQAARRRVFAHPLFEKGIVDRSLLERLEINSPLFWQVAAALPLLIAVVAILWRYTRRGVAPIEESVA